MRSLSFQNAILRIFQLGSGGSVVHFVLSNPFGKKRVARGGSSEEDARAGDGLGSTQGATRGGEGLFFFLAFAFGGGGGTTTPTVGDGGGDLGGLGPGASLLVLTLSPGGESSIASALFWVLAQISMLSTKSPLWLAGLESAARWLSVFSIQSRISPILMSSPMEGIEGI